MYNSPYAFSENRVIDGVELEGLEYFSVHYKIYVDQKGKPHRSLERVVSHRNTEKGYGRKGPGIKYIITHQRHSADGETYSFKAVQFVKNRHGIYTGGNNPKKYWKDPDSKGNYADDYSLPPIDILDAAAKQHDLDYDEVKAAGAMDALFNKKLWAQILTLYNEQIV
ncbi:hypothetical protein AAG747_16480 [Rapidithrix thailandica]|uniref:Uncharacterized protein n=1 Tax=Rapidithrix thailandica TaxID=413964 RepID=A0AAW9SFA0_9BACT